MVVNFDIFNRIEKPSLVLANGNFDRVSPLGSAYGIGLELNLADLSTLTFEISKNINGEDVQGYDECVGKRLVLVEDVGYFKLENPKIVHDGIKEIKTCTAYSLETEFRQKTVTNLSGTFKFYDPITPQDSLIGLLLQEIPSWSVGNIDSSLWNLFRTFEVSDQNLYGFIMSEVSDAYQCVFTFDTFNRKVNVKSIDNVGEETSIFLSFDNLVKNLTIEENSEEIITGLKVYGGNGLNVRSVNPNGTDILYNFTHFKDQNFLSAGLVTAINNYESLFTSLQPTYSSNLTSLKSKNAELLVAQGELVILQNELLALIGVQNVRIQASQSYSDINTQIDAKEAQINSKQSQINTISGDINNIQSALDVINNQLLITNNFTQSQISELDSYTIVDTYQDNTFIVTDDMTEEQKTEVAQELYDFGENILSNISQPRYSFDVDSANFIFLKEFQPFIDQLELGNTITLSVREDYVVNPIIIGYSYSYEDDTSFKLKFATNVKGDNSFKFTDLVEGAINEGKTVSFDKLPYIDWNRNNKDVVTEFRTSALNAANNNVISGDNQQVLINENGITLRQYDDNISDYEDDQMRIINNMIAISDDGFRTASLALGRINFNGTNVFGLVCDVLVGNLVAGNNLLITNSNNTFEVDETGATLTDASFTLTTTDGRGKIIIDPDLGIRVQGNTGGTFVDKFFVDVDGNVKFTGDLTGSTGTFSGALSAATGTFAGDLVAAGGTFNGRVLISNGDSSVDIDPNGSVILEIKHLTDTVFSVDDDGNAFFSGDISASTLTGSTFIGGTLKTSSSGERIEISGDDLHTYDNLNRLNGVQIQTFGSVYGLTFYDTDVFMGSISVNTSNDILFGVENDLILTSLSGIVRYNNSEIATIDDLGDINIVGSKYINVDQFNDQYIVYLDTSDTDDRYVQTRSGSELFFEIDQTLEVGKIWIGNSSGDPDYLFEVFEF